MNLRHLVPWLAAVLCAGCVSTGSVTAPGPRQPLSHQPEADAPARSVGLLRRLAVLPPVIEFAPRDAKDCAGPSGRCDWSGVLDGLANQVPLMLTQRRGYEVLSLDPRFVADGTGGSGPQRMALDPGQVQGWREALLKPGPGDAPTAPAAAAARAMGAALGIDGVVVVRGSVKTTSKTDEILLYGTFILWGGVLAARDGVALEALVFEAASGRLAWRGHYGEKTAISFEHQRSGFESGLTVRVVEKLFDGIEPALPRLFTTPVAPPTGGAR